MSAPLRHLPPAPVTNFVTPGREAPGNQVSARWHVRCMPRVCTAMVPLRRPSSSGFTLVELMAVVIIVGVLATIAVYGMRRYFFSAKSSEAMTLLSSISAAQEEYRDETFTYLETSPAPGKLYPMENPGRFKQNFDAPGHDDYRRWRALGVQTNEPVQYGYRCRAGGAGVTLPTEATANNLNVPGDRAWFVCSAEGDVDGDGIRSLFVANSGTTEIFAKPGVEDE